MKKEIKTIDRKNCACVCHGRKEKMQPVFLPRELKNEDLKRQYYYPSVGEEIVLWVNGERDLQDARVIIDHFIKKGDL